MSDVPGHSIQSKSNKKILCALLILLFCLLVAAACIIIPAYQEVKKENIKAMAIQSGHFQNENNLPELLEEGIKGSITEAYYTKDGELMLKLKLANGSVKDMHPKTLDVTLKNENMDTIAVAGTDVIDPDFMVPAGGYADMTFYVPSEYIIIKDDNLDILSYDVQVS